MGGQPERNSVTPDWDDDETGYRADEVVTVKVSAIDSSLSEL